MIKRIFVSETDRDNLSTRKTFSSKKVDRSSYNKVVVKKPWGYEYLMYENDFLGIWILSLKKNEGTSMHCHPNKKTSLLVLSGQVLVSTLNDWFRLKRLDGLVLEPGVFHSSRALTNKVMIMEIESPNDKRDLVRLKDDYSREKQGYEGKNKRSSNLTYYDYCFFSKKEIRKQLKQKIGLSWVCIKKCLSNFLEDEVDINNKSKVYGVLEKKIVNEAHKQLFEVGNIFSLKELGNFDSVRLYNNSMLLTVEKVKRKK